MFKRTYTEKEFQEFLRRIKSGRLPKDVANDPDMPSYESVSRKTRKDPKFKARYYEAIHSLPYKLQASIQMLSPRFDEEVKQMHSAGMTAYRIAKIFEVTEQTVHRSLKGGTSHGHSKAA